MTIAFILFLIALIIAIPMRVWEYATVIDHVTGFFTSHPFSVWGFLVLFILVTVGMAIFVIKDKNTMDYPYREGTKGLGLLFLLLGVLSILGALGQIWTLPGAKTPFMGTIFLYALGISSLLLGFLFLLKKTNNTFTRLIIFVPLLWVLVKVWSIYLGEKPILTVSQHLMELLGYVALMLFLMAFAYCVASFG